MNDKKKQYLMGLVYGQIPKEKILAGFIKHYVLEGQSLVHLQSDIALTSWPVAAGEAARRVVKELESFVDQRLPETCPLPKGPMTFAAMLGEEPAVSSPHPEE